MSDLPSQLCCLQLWLHLCAQACPGLQVSRHKIKPCQPADFSAKPAFLLLSNGCTPTAWLLVVCVEEQMSTQLVAVVITREETATEEAGLKFFPSAAERSCVCQMAFVALPCSSWCAWDGRASTSAWSSFVKVRVWSNQLIVVLCQCVWRAMGGCFSGCRFKRRMLSMDRESGRGC